MATWVQVIAITSALLPVVGAVGLYVGYWVDGLPTTIALQRPVQELAVSGANTVATPALLASWLVFLIGWALPLGVPAWPLSRRQSWLSSSTGLVMVVFTVILLARAAVFGPFPEAVATISAYCALLVWIFQRSISGKIRFQELAVRVGLVAILVSAVHGLNGATFSAQYVKFEPGSANTSGWYFDLSDHDNVTLIPCLGGGLITVPWSSINSIDHSWHGPDVDTSLAHSIQSMSLPPFGDVFVCPGPGQPPPH